MEYSAEKLRIPRLPTPHAKIDDAIFGEFDEGPAYETWRPRGTGDWLLIYTVGGAGLLQRRQRKIEVPEGHLLLYRPGAYQHYGSAPNCGRWHLLFSHFLPRPHWLAWFNWPETWPGLLITELPESVRDPFCAALREALREGRAAHALSADLKLNSLERALILARATAGTGSIAQVDPRIRRAIEHITTHTGHQLSVDDLAAQAGLSPSRFAHLFKAQTGQSPQQTWERHKLHAAADLLGFTALTVAEIADRVGYEDPLYFSRRFRTHFGESPVAWREKARENPPPPATGEAPLQGVAN